MASHPSHLDGYLRAANDKFGGVADGNHHYFRLICRRCLSATFKLEIGDKQSVRARCVGCRNEVLLYDLALYPAATKAKGSEAFRPAAATEREGLPVYVGYEYGPLDDDMEFDRNDITWFEVFVESKGELVKVFDDETA